MKERDPLWKYVEDVGNGRVRCIFCRRDYVGRNISRLKKHWAQLCKLGIDACTKVPQHVKYAALSVLENSSNTRSRSSYKNSKTAGDDYKGKSVSSTTHLAKGLAQCSLAEGGRNGTSKVDEKLAKFIMVSGLPFDFVELPCFIDFLRNAVEFGSDYKLPSSSQLQKDIFPRFEEQVDKHIKGVEKSYVQSGCTVMLENLSDYIFLIVHTRKGAVFRKSFETSGLHLNNDFNSQIERIGIKNIVQFVSNDDSVIGLVRERFISKYPQIYLIPCVAREIHCLLKAIGEVNWVKETIHQAVFMVQIIYQNADILSLMKKYTNKDLKQPCPSKFASYYQMLQSISSNKNELQHLIASQEWSLLSAKHVADIIQSTGFWSQLQEVLKAMEPLIQVLRLVEESGSTSGYLYEAMEKARKVIHEYYNNDTTKYIQIWNLLERGIKNIIHPIHTASAFLNPAYMWQRNFEMDANMKEAMGIILSNLETDEEKVKFVQEMELYIKRVSNVFTETAIIKIRTSHPWVWWEYCGDYLPTLRKHAMRILGQPCKCSFYLQHSIFEVAQRKKMNSSIIQLSDDVVKKPINTMFMEETRTKEEQCLKPIVIENCNELPDYADPTQGCIDQMELNNGGSISMTDFMEDSLGFIGNSIGAQEPAPFQNWPQTPLDMDFAHLSSQMPNGSLYSHNWQ